MVLMKTIVPTSWGCYDDVLQIHYKDAQKFLATVSMQQELPLSWGIYLETIWKI